jgi:TonB family protein
MSCLFGQAINKSPGRGIYFLFAPHLHLMLPAAAGSRVMRLIVSAIAVLTLATLTYSQSGRRAKETKVSVPLPAEEVNEPKQKAQPEDAPTVRAQRNEDYRCTEDGSLARILDADDVEEQVFSSKKVDTRVVVTSKPPPSYTREARRNGVQGFVALKLLLSGSGKISRVRVVKGLPAGLTESAIRAACKIKFKPATKDGQTVSQWLTAEYVFRLADSSIFGP